MTILDRLVCRSRKGAGLMGPIRDARRGQALSPAFRDRPAATNVYIVRQARPDPKPKRTEPLTMTERAVRDHDRAWASIRGMTADSIRASIARAYGGPGRARKGA